MMSKSMNEDSCTVLVRFAKIFLNRKHEFDRDMPCDDGIFDWSKKSNFLSLLNICENIPKIGPPALYWEGGACGEKAIQLLKPIIHGLVLNWQKNTLLRFYRGRLFQNICNSLHNNTSSIKTKVKSMISNTAPGNYKNYRTLQKLKVAFINYEPISVLFMVSQKFAVMIKSNEYVEVFLDQSHPIMDQYGIIYHKCTLAEDVKTFTTVTSVERECLFLPMHESAITGDIGNSAMYYVITSDWTEMTVKTQFT